MYYALFDFEYDKFAWSEQDKDKKNVVKRDYYFTNPDLYKIGLNNECFSYGLFIKWLLYGLVQAVVVYFLAFFLVMENNM